MELGSVILVISVQLQKANGLIVVTELGKSTLIRSLQWKAWLPIDVTELGIVILVSDRL